MKKNTGFTLVELAIVLVIIGLILGMAFKGKDLIDTAKVKNLAAQYNKIMAASNTFYEKYGFYPGDGCTVANPTNIATQCAGTRNGVIDSAIEQTAFWNLLVSTTNILTAADQHTVFGSDWNISLNNIGVAGNGASATGNVGNNYLFAGTNPANAVANSRFVCALDKMIDDGIFNRGTIRSNNNYTQATDCWTLTTQATILIKVLP